MIPTTTSANVYTDFKQLEDLKRQARADSPEAAAKVAKQFEGVFLQMMIKSMRDANQTDGPLNTQETRFFQDMHDKQLALHLADHAGIGLAKVLADQLSHKSPTPQGTGNQSLDDYRHHPVQRTYSVRRDDNDSMAATDKMTQRLRNSTNQPLSGSKEAFVERILPFAQQAAEELGVAPEVLVAQAALETGWGKSVLRQDNGETSYNLFNIKAGGQWKGGRATVAALEFEDGVMQKRRSSFRAYQSFEDSFNDYVDFLKSNPRYREALENVRDPRAYMRSLQDAGYATDPNYANKVMRIYEGIKVVVSERNQGVVPEG